MDRFLIETFGVDATFFEGASILDVGAGTGGIHDLEVDCQSVVIDPLAHDFREVTEKSQNEAELCTAVGEHLPFSDATFDYVWSTNVLDHMINPYQALAEMRRVLKTEGQLFLNVNVFSIPQWVRTSLHYIDSLHPYHFAPREVTEIVTDARFDIQSARYEREKLTNVAGTVPARLKAGAAKYVFQMGEVMLTATPRL
jgi:ubiquinone/menaquinone biosynthesis C-methylase UbiE